MKTFTLALLLLASPSHAADQWRLMCVSSEIDRVYTHKMELVTEEARNKDGKKEFWFDMTAAQKDKLVVRDTFALDADHAIEVAYEFTLPRGSIAGKFRLVGMKGGKIVRVLSESDDLSDRTNTGLYGYLKNLDAVNLQVADGLATDAPFDVKRITGYIKDGKLTDGAPLYAHFYCQPKKLTVAP